jgi:hypothetical protein
MYVFGKSDPKKNVDIGQIIKNPYYTVKDIT